MEESKPLRLNETFAVLKPDLGVDTVQFTPAIYEQLDREYNGFAGQTLIAIHEFERSRGSWEMHPAGDETVVLLSGRATFRIRNAEEDETVELKVPGEYLVVPKGRWHTSETNTPTRLLFITPGEGTRHARDLP